MAVKLAYTEHINFGNLDGWAMSREVFAWLIDNLNDNDTIVEFGSGTGTVELAKFFDVHSVENDKAWMLVGDTNYIHAPLKRNGWYDPTVMDKLPDEYKLVIIDGPKGSKARRGIIPHAHKLRKDAYIIVDDTHRLADFKLASELAEILGRDMRTIDGHEKHAIILMPIGYEQKPEELP